MSIPRPTTRLLALLGVLQARDLVSGAELARRLEVDGRSVRRYIAMLNEIGVPVETVRGPHGGYRLRPGLTIPPLLLTDEEAIALALALGAVPVLGLELGAGVAAGLRAKLERTLPAGVRARVRALEGHVAFAPGPAMAAEGATIAALGEAAAGGRRVRLRYRSEGGAETERIVEPYGVARWGQAWYLVAYCHLRSGVRVFRVDRIAAAESLAARFAPPRDFDPYAHVARAMAAFPGEWAVTVALDLPIDRARETVLAPYGTLEADGTAGRSFAGGSTIWTGWRAGWWGWGAGFACGSRRSCARRCGGWR